MSQRGDAASADRRRIVLPLRSPFFLLRDAALSAARVSVPAHSRYRADEEGRAVFGCSRRDSSAPLSLRSE